MTEPQKKIDTGISELDTDVADLLAMTDGQFDHLAELLKKDSVVTDELSKAISINAARAVVVVGDKDLFSELLKKTKPESHSVLQKAKALINEKLPLNTSKVFWEWLKKKSEMKEEDSDGDTSLAWNTPTKMVVVPSLLYINEKLIPTLRVGMRDNKNNRLIDMTLEWDDAFFIVSVILEKLANEFREDQRQSQAKQEILYLSDEDRQKIAKKLDGIQQSLHTLARYAEIFKIHSPQSTYEKLKKLRGTAEKLKEEYFQRPPEEAWREQEFLSKVVNDLATCLIGGETFVPADLPRNVLKALNDPNKDISNIASRIYEDLLKPIGH